MNRSLELQKSDEVAASRPVCDARGAIGSLCLRDRRGRWIGGRRNPVHPRILVVAPQAAWEIELRRTAMLRYASRFVFQYNARPAQSRSRGGCVGGSWVLPFYASTKAPCRALQ